MTAEAASSFFDLLSPGEGQDEADCLEEANPDG
jgi:hypothetical protein